MDLISARSALGLGTRGAQDSTFSNHFGLAFHRSSVANQLRSRAEAYSYWQMMRVGGCHGALLSRADG
jgi:hypothetical protein